MDKLFRKFFLLVITLQTIVGIISGLFIVSFTDFKEIPINIYVDDLLLGGMHLDDLPTKLDDYFKGKIKNQVLSLEVDKKLYKIAFSDFDVSLDTKNTIENVKSKLPASSISLLLDRSSEKVVIKPVLNINEGKLCNKLESILKVYESEPTIEHFEIKEGILQFIKQTPGIKVYYELLTKELKERLVLFSQDFYTIDPKSTPVFYEVKAEGHKENFNTIVSKASITIDEDMLNRIQIYSELINGQVFKKGEEINFRELIDISKITQDVELDLVSRIATSLYQTALPVEDINILNRKPSKYKVSYSQAGLEAVIDDEKSNLVLKNETERTILLLTEVMNDKLTCYIVSTGKLKSGVVTTQKKDEIPPPIITMINEKLSKGETRTLNEGHSGYTVSVIRTIDNKPHELYIDKYQPVSKIVESSGSTLEISSK